MTADAGVRTAPGKSNDCDEALRKNNIPKAKPVEEAESTTDGVKELRDTQLGSNGQIGN